MPANAFASLLLGPRVPYLYQRRQNPLLKGRADLHNWGYSYARPTNRRPSTSETLVLLSGTLRKAVAVPLSFICYECDKLLSDVNNAMRRHIRVLRLALQSRRAASLERLEHFRASFFDAELAWDSYRGHIHKHGLAPTMRSRRLAT